MNYDIDLNACILKKSYGDIFVTVIIELPEGKIESRTRKKALNVLKDDLANLLNDSELASLLNEKN